MLPLVGTSKRFIVRKKVDFPDPDGPIITRTSPCLISRSIPLSTSFLPKYLCKFLILISVSDISWHLLYQNDFQVI